MKILCEQEKPIVYDMRDIVKKILDVLKEDQTLNFGPRLTSAEKNQKTIKETISSKKQLLKKSKETLKDLESKLETLKVSNDKLREKLLEELGSEL